MALIDHFPVLLTERLDLRELDESHVDSLYRVWTDPAVIEFLVLDPFVEVGQAMDMISLLRGLYPDQGIRWAIVDSSSGLVVGTCGFHRLSLEHHRAEIGYELDSRFWRKGLMSEAVKEALRYGFGAMGLNRVEALVTVGNEASAGFLRSVGFSFEGTLRQYEFARGEFQDQWMFSLLREDR